MSAVRTQPDKQVTVQVLCVQNVVDVSFFTLLFSSLNDIHDRAVGIAWDSVFTVVYMTMDD
jgi:hypothetical protein